MPNPEHEGQLRDVSKDWNGWRRSNASVVVDLEDGDFSKFDHALGGYDFNGGRLARINLEGRYLTYAQFRRTDLAGAILRRTNLGNANLEGADLRGADLSDAELGNTSWSGAKLDHATRLDRIRFAEGHLFLDDGSDAIEWPPRDRIVHWGKIRALGSLPLFQISYFALAASVLTITTVGFLNANAFVEFLRYPIPVPARMSWLVVTSVLLAVGSTMYRLKCPDRIREFSETQWVEQFGRARLQYRREALRNRGWQVPTGLFLVSGGIGGLGLLLERLWVAIRYLFAAM